MIFVIGMFLFVVGFAVGIGWGDPHYARWNKWDRIAQVLIIAGMLTMWASVCIFLWGVMP